MGALASLMLEKGHRVSGSDLKENQLTLQLQEKGARVFLGHEAKNIEGADFIIYSSAIPLNNPEMVASREKNIPILKRAQLLAYLMEDYTSITVAGAHGKTTTTSMVSQLLMTAGLNPTTAIGGIVNGTSTNAALGKGNYFVSELDESDGTFLLFQPFYSIITNIDFEHVDFYRTWENITKAYQDFIQGTHPKGMVIGCREDSRLVNLLNKAKRRYQLYGLSSQSHVYAQRIEHKELSSSFDCYGLGKKLGEVKLQVPGRHNVLNALACVTLGLNMEIPFVTIKRSLFEFRGVKRRFQIKGEENDILVVDDYGHHPTEIQATLQAAKTLNKRRLIAVFQPHRYSRLKFLWKEFAQSLLVCDHVIITDVYAASEKPLEGITSQKFQEYMGGVNYPHAVYLKKEDILSYLLDFAKPGDLVLTLGAGDVTKISDELVLELKKSVSLKKF